jgi:NAD(P)-dependent dehydrogenase (short-subunit alcohol dehydrogenase family)
MNNQLTNLSYEYFQADASNVESLRDVENFLRSNKVNLSGIVNCHFHPEIIDPKENIPTGSGINQLESAFRRYTDVSFTAELSGNISSTHNVIRTFLPTNFDEEFSVVNVSSVYGLQQPNPTILEFPDKFVFKPPGYGVSKSGIIAYTKYLANLYAGTKFRFNSIAPGFVDAGQNTEFKSRFNNRLSLRRFASLEEIASPIEFLLSSSSSYITGSTLVVDGGYTTT